MKSLTPREKQILSKMCLGMTSKEIAAHYDIAQSTVENYKQRLFNKFHARNAVDLAVKAQRMGLLSDEVE